MIGAALCDAAAATNPSCVVVAIMMQILSIAMTMMNIKSIERVIYLDDVQLYYVMFLVSQQHLSLVILAHGRRSFLSLNIVSVG